MAAAGCGQGSEDAREKLKSLSSASTDGAFDTGKVMRAAKRANVRAGPGTSYAKVDTLKVGEHVRVSNGPGTGSDYIPHQGRQSDSSTDHYSPRSETPRWRSESLSDAEPLGYVRVCSSITESRFPEVTYKAGTVTPVRTASIAAARPSPTTPGLMAYDRRASGRLPILERLRRLLDAPRESSRLWETVSCRSIAVNGVENRVSAVGAVRTTPEPVVV